MTKFRLTAGRPAPSMNRRGPSASLPEEPAPTRRRNRDTGTVGTLTCGHKVYEPYVRHGKLYWCEDCQHNREMKPASKPTPDVADDQDVLPF